MRYESAGDQFCGRTVCGLPPQQVDFGFLPPFFSGERTTDIQQAIKDSFGSFPDGMTQVLEFSLAAICFHYEFICAIVPEGSVVRTSPLFSHNRILMLRPLVECRLPRNGDVITVTGVPPNIAILSHISSVRAGLDSVTSAVVEGVKQVLEERDISTGTVSRQFIQSMFQQFGQSMQATASGTEGATPCSDKYLIHFYEGKFHRLPQSYRLPKCSFRHVFVHWMLGSDGVPPLRALHNRDLPTVEDRKRLSDLRSLMSKLESSIRSSDSWIENPKTSADVNQMFDHGMLRISHETAQGRHRRLHQLCWTTVVRHLLRHTSTPY